MMDAWLKSSILVAVAGVTIVAVGVMAMAVGAMVAEVLPWVAAGGGLMLVGMVSMIWWMLVDVMVN